MDADVSFLFGLSAVAAAEDPSASEPARMALLDEAIGAYHAMLVERPDLVRVHLEIARAFYLKGDDDLAKQHFELVLAGDLPQEVAANIRGYLSRIRARKRWSAQLGLSLVPDNNVGSRSGEEIFYLFGLPFRRSEEDLPTSGVGVTLWAGGEYQHPLGQRYRLRTGGSLMRTDYASREQDSTTVSGHIGPRWLVSRQTEASLLASARQKWLAGDPDHHDLGLRIQLMHKLGARTTMTAEASWHDRQYNEQTSFDTPVIDASVGTKWAATPTVRLNAKYGWGRERPEPENWHQIRRWIEAGAEVALPRGFSVGVSGTLRWANYGGNWYPYTEFGENRRDTTRTLRVSAYNRAFTLAGFSPQVSLGLERRSSNAQLRDYDRNFAELSLVRMF